jgi:hypothetical protein
MSKFLIFREIKSASLTAPNPAGGGVAVGEGVGAIGVEAVAPASGSAGFTTAVSGELPAGRAGSFAADEPEAEEPETDESEAGAAFRC